MMYEPTAITWILIVFGTTTCLPLFISQLTILRDPHGQKARDILIGKGKDWRDRTHFRSAYALAWADWLLFLPLLAAGSTGVILGYAWGYVLWGTAGGISLYINTVLWVMEKEYVYPSCGPLAYYTYYWGFFMLWGLLALLYTLFRLSEFMF